MRLSSLVVASILTVSTSLLAQHSVTSSASSSSSSSSSSHGSSPSTSASHSSASGASSSAHSASAHSSSASAPHNSSTGSVATRSRDAKALREPNKTAKEGHEVGESGKKPQPEHKKVFAFLHRRQPKPSPKGVQHPVEAELRRQTCPPGQSINKAGACITSGATNASAQCPPNTYGGVSCTNKIDQCASFRGQLDAAAAELRSINAEMRNASCSGASPTQECGFLGQRRDAAVAHYWSIQSGIPATCRGTFPDPFSL